MHAASQPSVVSKLLHGIWPRGVYYAKPRSISDLSQCAFYHTMEIPGYGLVEAQWDLRPGIREYTGGIDFRGRRVLEIGTASGFVCFYMEQQGAEVIAYDLSEEQAWDVVPIATADYQHWASIRRLGIRKLNNGYWLAHKAFGSKAKVVYGTVYDIPRAIGPVDASTFGSVLVHLRDPFLALQNAARLTRDTILVTDVLSPTRVTTAAPGAPALPLMEFIPNFRNKGPLDSWWFLSPEIVVAFLGALGFEDSDVRYHVQQFSEGERKLFSVIARRTAGKPLSS